MDWRHQVSEEWMKARRNYLTASELSSCIASWKRANKAQKAGDELLPAFVKLWAKKQSEDVDVWSKGPAARGHILEPYAVDDWNKNFPSSIVHHWDDCLITDGVIGWSPDALDIPQDNDAVEIKASDVSISYALEIKSYEPAKIIESRITDKDKIPERWQIACGFYVVPTLETYTILFYSIDTNLSCYKIYGREDLAEELEQIGDMASAWYKNKQKLDRMPIEFDRSFSETEVYEEYLETSEDIFMF